MIMSFKLHDRRSSIKESYSILSFTEIDFLNPSSAIFNSCLGDEQVVAG